jgi:hypothetical protein
MTADYDWEDDAKRGYALWIAIMRARLRIVLALKVRAGGQRNQDG